MLIKHVYKNVFKILFNFPCVNLNKQTKCKKVSNNLLTKN